MISDGFGLTFGAQLGPFDIAHYAAAFGAHGYQVSTEDEFLAALDKALSEEGPSIIDVPVDYSHSTSSPKTATTAATPSTSPSTTAQSPFAPPANST